MTSIYKNSRNTANLGGVFADACPVPCVWCVFSMQLILSLLQANKFVTMVTLCGRRFAPRGYSNSTLSATHESLHVVPSLHR